ncbi:MAG: hypothetical protein ACI87W_002947 [Halieaceae bacterium]|jgi:hypothetical protein
MDLVVLNLIAEFWSQVSIDSFSTSLLTAILLQVLLQGTLILEHRVAGWFYKKEGAAWGFLRYFSAWLILFGSKFVMLGAIDRVMGDAVQFHGSMHGVLAFIVVIVAMLGAEELFARFYRRLS